MLNDARLRLQLYPRLLEFGMAYGDLLSIEDRLGQGDYERWSQGIFELAEAYEDRARHRGRASCPESAGSYYRRACDYFHFAGFRSLSATLTRESSIRSKACFEAWRACAGPPLRIEPLRCLDEIVTVHCSGWSNKQLVILIGGLDSSKECELWYFSRYFADRGMDVVYTDFPGQGELLGRLSLVEHGDAYARAFLETVRRRASAASIGVFGVSLGGYLALRTAALSPEIEAAVSLGGFFDAAPFGNLRPEAKPQLSLALTLDPQAPLDDLNGRISLSGTSKQLGVPALIVHGEEDHLVDESQVRAIARWAPRATVRTVAGAEHVATSRFAEILPEMADWMKCALSNAD